MIDISVQKNGVVSAIVNELIKYGSVTTNG